MAKGFTLSVLPWAYIAKYQEENIWTDHFTQKPYKKPEEEAKLDKKAYLELMQKRNSFEELPLVNYTTQYGMGCFEGLKAFPWKDNSLHIFRPDRNAARMKRSMEGLKMPPFPADKFIYGVTETVRRNKELGFFPKYMQEWEKDDFVSGHSIYIRPFSYSEPAIGLGLSMFPWVVIINTPVGAYFAPGNAKAVTTKKIRAFPGGTGWIKCDANSVIPILAKKEAEASGFMEAIFLDAYEHTYIEEGSSCNFFVRLNNGALVTPELGDTVLPGISRESIITLAQDMGVPTEERRISIEEAMEEGTEVFVTGTAAGVSYIESITHNGRTKEFAGGKPGELTLALRKKLKGIQYGVEEDIHNWMIAV